MNDNEPRPPIKVRVRFPNYSTVFCFSRFCVGPRLEWLFDINFWFDDCTDSTLWWNDRFLLKYWVPCAYRNKICGRLEGDWWVFTYLSDGFVSILSDTVSESSWSLFRPIHNLEDDVCLFFQKFNAVQANVVFCIVQRRWQNIKVGWSTVRAPLLKFRGLRSKDKRMTTCR